MKKIIYKLLGVLLFYSATNLTNAQINPVFLGRYSTGFYDKSAAEISAYHSRSKQMFVLNAADTTVKVVNISNPASPLLVSSISIKPYGIDLTSIACYNDIIAVTVIDSLGKTENGKVVFFNANTMAYINQVDVGANPDMVCFSPDGTKVLVANEGEPNVGYTIDPEGSVSIVNITGGLVGLTQANVQTAGFTSFNGTNIDRKIKITGKIQSGGVFSRYSTVAEDLEPEYITVSANSLTAWVTCQENNCIAEVNLNTATVTRLIPLGYKNHSLTGNGLDASNQGSTINIAPNTVFGMYMPDAISNYTVGGNTYLVTANEGDVRADWGTANSEETDVRNSTYVLDTTKFINAANVAFLKSDVGIGRLKVSSKYGDFDGDGKFDSIFCFGGRSFTIWNATTGAIVWDSKDDFEQRTALLFPNNFNASNTNNTKKNRSDDKGPEPEAITIGKILDSTYAFIGLERIGGVMIYNITNPNNPYFVNYINTRDFSQTPGTNSGGDLGPEGIVFIPASESPNGVNMIMLSNEVSGTVALFNINTPETEGISKLQDYKNNNSAIIGTFQGINYKEAGFSSLFPIPNTNGTEFWTCSDRGVNIDGANANTTSCRPTYDKIYAFPSYSPKIHRIRIAGDSIQILQTISIKRPNGTGATGIINPTGLGSTATEVASTDTVLNCANFSLKTTPKDTFGIDPEGLVVDKNGNFWLCEEGGATIWKLNQNGVLMNRYTPYAHLAGKQAVDIQIDSVFKYRKNNRGFEGISITPNGKIYAMIQSGIQYPTATIGDNTRIHRILEIDPATNNQRMLVYLNDGIIGAGSNQIRLRDWKIGDMAAVNDSIFLVLEAAARGTSDIKRLYQININQATAVHSGLYGSLTLEGLVDSTGLANNGIKPVTKTLVMDLLASGWPAELDKAEGLAIINDSTIAIGNDNDFGQTSLLANGIATATGNLSHLITYRLSGAKKLANYKPSVLSVSTQSAYLTPEAPGVKIDPILTVGDEAQNGYKLAGLGDGTGAFDNGNGTFTFLLSHEINNLLGVNRAHGAKGAFVSKWVINKNDLSVISGADLIQKVNIYTPGVGYTLYNPADTTSKKAFSRFCSSDLPSISAFYNALTGLGTQERIFMNGEEAGAEGRAFAHIVTGTNAGTTYELPALGKFSWENAVASSASGDKTVVAGTDDGTDGQVYFYVGTKTNAGNEMDKAGLTNGRLYGISVTGLPAEISATVPAQNTTFSMVDLGIVKDSTGLALNNRSNALLVTKFLRPEDGAFDPSNPNDFYFVTTNSFSAPSKMWRLRFIDIKNPVTGGTITAVLDGTEGPKMMDNIAIDNFGHVIIQEDPGNQTHLAKIWQYTIANDQIKLIASHDSTRFIAGGSKFLTQDEESSGVIDVQDILGAGNFLLFDQAHYSLGGELVEGGQMLKMFVPTNNYTLQVLHSSDMESSIDAVIDAPNFAAVMNKLEGTYANTVKLASGDCFIPSPFLSAGEDASVQTPLRNTASSYFSGSTAGLRAAIGRVDVSMMNIMGFQGSALGNHEFDLGTSEVNSIIGVDIRSNGADKRWIGAQFPYLSANLDFSGDANLSYLYTNKRLSVDSFKTSPTITANSQKKGLAPSSIVIVNGEKIGLVGATTQLLENISSPGLTKVVGSKTDNMLALAAILQPVIDSLRFVEGINKIIVMSHLQQLANEKALAPLLKGVDIIIAGGSHSLCADGNDRLRAGNVAADKYPIMTQNNDNEPLAILNTTAEWKYVGRFVANFTEAGVLIPSLLDSVINGAYAADTAMVTSLWGNYNSAFATGTKGANVRILCAAIGNVIINKDGNKFGKSSVFLEGRRDFVRTQETNLGNVSSDANLWLAKKYDSQVRVSIKNGGGIRSAIGQVVSIGNGVQLLPTAANPTANKNVGDISQLDIENSLRFNNKLSIVSVNAAGLKRLLEHGVSASKPGITPGQFPQVGGVMFSYDTTRAAGSKIQSMVLVDSIGNRLDTIVRNGVVYGDTSRTIKVVTLDFLAGGGDSYPFLANGFNRINLDTAFKDSLYAKFQANGTEQDAFADYMYAKHNSTPYAVRDTNLLGDNRIQLLNARQDGIFPPVVPVISIAAARALNTDTVKVRGIITRAWGRFIYIQDGTGAIGVRQSSGAMVDSIVSGGLKAGDSVEVSGGRSDFNNYSQIALQSGLYRGKSIINKIMSNRPLPPVQLLTVKQLLANPEAYESELIRIENLRTSSTGNFAASTNHNVWDGTTTGDTTIFRVISAADTEIEDAPALAVPTGLFTFEGTLIQFCSSPTSGCTNGYQLQGVRKGDILPQIVIPVLGLFNLANPANNSRIVTDSASTSNVQVNWTKSTNATLYKWMLTSQAGTFTAPLLTLLSNNAGVDSTLTLSSGSVDAILAGLGIAKGDSVKTKWTVFSYKSSTDSLQASQVFNLTLARSKVVLGAFNLTSPANSTRLVVEQNNTTPVVINWSASSNTVSYKWKAATLTGNFSSPLLNLSSDNAGLDNKLTLTSGTIDGILATNGIVKGDSITLQWSVFSFRNTDSLKAIETFNVKLVRQNNIGVNNVSFAQNINVYPNPTQTDLFINSNNITGKLNMRLYSITGQLLIEENMEASMTNKINVSNLQDGIYMLSITGNNGKNATIKVVITH